MNEAPQIPGPGTAALIVAGISIYVTGMAGPHVSSGMRRQLFGFSLVMVVVALGIEAAHIFFTDDDTSDPSKEIFKLHHERPHGIEDAEAEVNAEMNGEERERSAKAEA